MIYLFYHLYSQLHNILLMLSIILTQKTQIIIIKLMWGGGTYHNIQVMVTMVMEEDLVQVSFNPWPTWESVWVVASLTGGLPQDTTIKA